MKAFPGMQTSGGCVSPGSILTRYMALSAESERGHTNIFPDGQGRVQREAGGLTGHSRCSPVSSCTADDCWALSQISRSPGLVT